MPDVIVPKIPEGPLSAEVEFKALPSVPLAPSPTPEGTIGEKIQPPVYAQEQHTTWATLFKQQQELLPGRVCNEYLQAQSLLDIETTKVPNLGKLSGNLFKHSGWQIIRVNGYVPEAIFFKLLANKCFPCTV